MIAEVGSTQCEISSVFREQDSQFYNHGTDYDTHHSGEFYQIIPNIGPGDIDLCILTLVYDNEIGPGVIYFYPRKGSMPSFLDSRGVVLEDLRLAGRIKFGDLPELRPSWVKARYSEEESGNLFLFCNCSSKDFFCVNLHLNRYVSKIGKKQSVSQPQEGADILNTTDDVALTLILYIYREYISNLYCTLFKAWLVLYDYGPSLEPVCSLYSQLAYLLAIFVDAFPSNSSFQHRNIYCAA